jgi:catechol 2,3-dioxygenase-like lactoylglutathione lyase family enzyme
MTHRGFSHLGLSTLDLDKTRAFYEACWVSSRLTPTR